MAKFKTRARAVDMLGRQQIAGVPNAISELFKNAHDAYADQAIVDYFRSDRLFVLRDDGLGMTQDDFENRWLTIGTESKVNSPKGILKPPIDPSKPNRPITGEKGIGRLAIAAIGSQVLVLTRAKRENQLGDLVAAFLHWGLFALPGINLEQIDIPLKSFPGGTLPTNNDIREMVEKVGENVASLYKEGYIEDETFQTLNSDLKAFNLDIQDTPNYLGKPSLLKNGHGTHFYILPAREELTEDLELLQEEDRESRIRKLLLGFTNTMVPKHQPSRIMTALRYWRSETDTRPPDIIGEGEFFTPQEFSSADHHLQGRFDEFGQFVGTVSVYGEEILNHVVPWPRGRNKPVSCGPFRINVAVVPGVLRQSKMPSEEWARLSAKSDKIGGLYIYKDGIRVLPYGDNDVDFLDIEKRRSKGAAYYFFSYRRMFGTIELTQDDNNKLEEKAGREGFQDNRAYREFKDILENFFIQIAADFFRVGGEYAKTFEETRNELGRLKNAREQQEKESQKKRKKFEAELERFFEKASSNKPAEDARTVIASLLHDIQEATAKQDEILLLNAEVDANRKLARLRNSYKVERPDGIGLTKQLSRDWDAFASEMDRLEREIFLNTQAEINSIITNASAELKFALDQKQRIELLVGEIVIESRNSVQGEIQATEATFRQRQKQFNELTQEITAAITETAKTVENQVREFDVINKTSEEIESYRRKLELQVNDEAQRYIEVLKHVRAQLESIEWYRDENGYLIGSAEITAALEDEVLALRERVDTDVELTQLGLALNIINHEFTNTIRAIRTGIRDLREWANRNPSLMPLYQEIYNGFTHLDSYLNMFTPLNRRLYRSVIEIKGSSIAKYLQDLFNERMIRHDVKLIVTEAFRKTSISGYPSSFYPVFVNLVDNAIFWLQDQPLPREITLDAIDGTFIISDNGPGIPNRDRSAVFDLGFTRKPGGRGMGLYISREVLKKEGFQLELDPSYSSKGTTFTIKLVDPST